MIEVNDIVHHYPGGPPPEGYTPHSHYIVLRVHNNGRVDLASIHPKNRKLIGGHYNLIETTSLYIVEKHRKRIQRKLPDWF